MIIIYTYIREGCSLIYLLIVNQSVERKNFMEFQLVVPLKIVSHKLSIDGGLVGAEHVSLILILCFDCYVMNHHPLFPLIVII